MRLALPDLRALLDDRRLRYLLAGGWNTVFGYGVGVILYLALSSRLHVVVIGALANVLSITMSFATYKIFVFRTRGGWLVEYIRSYVVYGISGVLGIGLLWAAVSVLRLDIWLAQAFTILVGVVISYVGHALFTFRRRPSRGVVN